MFLIQNKNYRSNIHLLEAVEPAEPFQQIMFTAIPNAAIWKINEDLIDHIIKTVIKLKL